MKRDIRLGIGSGRDQMYLDPDSQVLMYVEGVFTGEAYQDTLVIGDDRRALARDEEVNWPRIQDGPWVEPASRSEVEVLTVEREDGTVGYQVEFKGQAGPVVGEIEYLAVAPGGERVVYLTDNGKDEPLREEIMYVDHVPGPGFSSIGSSLTRTSDEWKETGRMPTGDGATDWVWEREIPGQTSATGGALFTSAGTVVYIGSNSKLEETVQSYRTYSEQSVVVDNEAGPELDRYGSIVVSPGGRHVAYVGTTRTGGQAVYVDTAGPSDYESYIAVSNPVWRSDSELLYHAIRREWEPGLDGKVRYDLYRVVRSM